MKLDAEKLRAEAEGHRARMQSPLWSDDVGKPGEDWTAKLNPPAHPPVPSAQEAAPRERVERPEPTDWEAFLSENEETSGAQTRTRELASGVTAQEIVPRLNALDHAVERPSIAMSQRPRGGGDVPGWLETAAGNPHTYDAPDAQRTGVCVRVLPTTYAQLRQIQQKLGLRTTAGAWEFLLRLGLAAVERLPDTS